MRQLLSLFLFLSLVVALSACDDREGETVETAFLYPEIPTPVYRFSRYGTSNVDTRESELINQALENIYDYYVRKAGMSFAALYQNMLNYYTIGVTPGYAPESNVDRSLQQASQRDATRKALRAYLQESARLSGLVIDGVAYNKRKRAAPGSPGFIGATDRSAGVHYADAKGMVVAEVFKLRAMGAIHLDQIYHRFLHDSLVLHPNVQAQHERLQLLEGHNYTALEAHWDQAYGHYKPWQKVLQGEGMPLLRGRETKIYQAFVQARTDLGRTDLGYLYYDFNSMRTQRNLIRQELARAIAARAIYHLVGPNTLANLHEEPSYAFVNISRAIGLIYALAYTCNPEGQPYFTHDQAEAMVNSLLKDSGLWDIERLKAPETTEGSLKNVATRLAQPWKMQLP